MGGGDVDLEPSTLGKTLLAKLANEIFAFFVDGGDVIIEMMLTTKRSTALVAFMLFQLWTVSKRAERERDKEFRRIPLRYYNEMYMQYMR